MLIKNHLKIEEKLYSPIKNKKVLFIQVKKLKIRFIWIDLTIYYVL